MNWLKRLFSLMLNPRIKLDDLPVSLSKVDPQEEAPGGRRSQFTVKEIIFNPPLVLGTLVILGLFVLVLFGPVWAPQNPYITGQHIVPHFDKEKGEFIRPPLPPSEEFPLGTDRWGTDLLSLLMHGARNTLIACAFITMVRLILGTILGGYAGWNEGQAVDRVIMGLIGVTTSIPMLISSMILIYALDIRKGLPVFIIALSVIGWTEIAQYIRSEFLVLRKMPFIEGAQVIGARGYAVAVRHIVPNILPQLLVISFLEMGAVLMLLGELGFVGVYIGGGYQIGIFEIMAPTEIFTLTEVPEWGAMLAEGYRWLRSKPFVVAPPATALFISIMGFNAMGEGLRRLIEKRGINTAFLLRKRMLLVVAGLTLATVFIINNTGASPWFTKVAQSFNGEAAYEHLETLSGMDGRGINQAGGAEAADYIEARFRDYGLRPGWKKDSYRYLIPARQVVPLEQPRLELLDPYGDPIEEYRHQIDFGFVIEGHGGSGDISLPVTFLGFTSGRPPDWGAYAGLDLRDRIVLLREGNAPGDFATEAMLHGARGVLWISGDGREDVRSQAQWVDFEREYQRPPGLPVFRIRPGVADALLEQAGTRLDRLFAEELNATQSGDGWFATDLEAAVRMSLKLSAPQNIQVPCILGYRIGSDLGIAADMVVLFVSYDGLGTDPDGTVFPGANHNASGVSILLEIARLWHEQELDPRRSVMFVAWSGGLGNETAREFLEDRFNFRHLITNNPNDFVRPATVIQLDYAGAGGETLLVHPNSTERLTKLLEDTVSETGLPVEARIDAPEFTADIVTRGVPWLSLRWADAGISPLDDRFETIDREKIQSLGETLSLMLIKLVRETDY
jgi:ABC-type dipeptide/oligopeptide/nickel transport system permease subunit